MRLPNRFSSLLALTAIAVLHSARSAAAAAEPVLESSAGGYIGTGTLGRDGCLYAPSTDGANGGIRKFTPDGGSILVTSFTGNGGLNRGATPSQLTLGRDGNFYGTTMGGGTSGYGTVFRLTHAGLLTTLADFPADSADPARNPIGGALLASDGNIYGTTSVGGPAHGGTIFSVSPTGVLTTRFSFFNYQGSSTGGQPRAPFVEGPDGQLFGAAFRDGPPVSNGAQGTNGVAFRFRPTSDSYEIVFNFNAANYSAGAAIFLPYVLARDGSLYGVSRSGGTGFQGIVFTLNPNGITNPGCQACGIGLVCQFYGGVYGPPMIPTAGGLPEAELTETPDGNLYGTTPGGTNYLGTVYRINVNPPTSSRYFLVTTQAGIGRLSLGADGNLHGGTYRLRFGPTPTTGDANAAATSATFGGTVNPNGAATSARFEYGLSPDALTALTPAQEVSARSAPVDLSAELTGLTPGTTYYFRARGDNANQFQPQRGRIRSFTTAGTAPAQVAINPDAGGRRVRFRGLAGVPNVVQWSNDLVAWQSLPSAVTPDAAGYVEFVDAEQKTPNHRFYRATTAP